MTIEELVRTVVETCWSDDAGLERMSGLVSPDYVHRSVAGDGPFEDFVAGMHWVGTVFTDRVYRVLDVVVDGDRAAARLEWSAVRVADRSRVTGRGAYHCTVREGLVVEDWDLFFPMS